VDLISLVSTIEELPETKSSGSNLGSREHGRRDPSRWPRSTLYPQKLTLTSPTSGSRSSRSQATEFIFLCFDLCNLLKCVFWKCSQSSNTESKPGNTVQEKRALADMWRVISW
jgi:hypothetical protein